MKNVILVEGHQFLSPGPPKWPLEPLVPLGVSWVSPGCLLGVSWVHPGCLLGDSRWLQMTPDGSRWLQMTPDDCRWFQMTPDDSRWLKMTPDDSRWFQMIPDASRWLQMTPDDSRWFQMLIQIPPDASQMPPRSNGFHLLNIMFLIISGSLKDLTWIGWFFLELGVFV